MAKPEWGTKRNCPKCGTRFYDLGKEDPVVCIDCGHEWVPEPILKSKQPIPQEPAPKKKVEAESKDEEEEAVLDDDIDLDEEDVDDVDDLDDNTDVSTVVAGTVDDED
ncbi:MAG: TIGR02300 family protein [Rhodothalassiaceae bacterium]